MKCGRKSTGEMLHRTNLYQSHIWSTDIRRAAIKTKKRPSFETTASDL